MKISGDRKVRTAIMLGTLCSVSYFAVYIARNILGSVSPAMIESGYTENFIGELSSLYFIFYAVGQLINGLIGDKLSARTMISFGLILAGVCNFVFPYIQNPVLLKAVYAMTGFFLSMIYAPMTKVVAENTEPVYATRCSLGYTFASFLGSPAAGILASFMVWQSVFKVSSVILWIMGAVCFICFILFERSGDVTYGRYTVKKSGKADKSGILRELIKRNILVYTVVSVVTGVIRTTVIFWLPTYLSQYLGFTAERAASLYSVITLIICANTFFAIFVYERIGRNKELSMLLMFLASFLSFVGAYFVKLDMPNAALIMLAIFFNNAASTIMWSVYCPSLSDTGVVSSVTGFLDFVSYMAAAASSTIFANAVSIIGWGSLILVWAGLMLFGLVICLTTFRKVKIK